MADFSSANKAPSQNTLESLFASGAMNSSSGNAPTDSGMTGSSNHGTSLTSFSFPFGDKNLPVGEVIGGNISNALRSKSVDEMLQTGSIADIDLNQFASLGPANLESQGRELNISEVGSRGLGLATQGVEFGPAQGLFTNTQVGGNQQ